jgi:hypothetical protein
MPSVPLIGPATVVWHEPGRGRIRVRFDPGRIVPSGPDEETAANRIAVLAAASTRGVPDTVDDVKAWVDEDPARAGRALQAERARPGGPRKTLEPWLEGLAAPDDDTGGDDAADDHEES